MHELERKLIHLSSLWIPLICYFWQRENALIVLAVVTIGMLVIDLVRISGGPVRRLFNIFFGSVLRQHESYKITGASYLLFSSLVTLYLFGSVVAAVACAYLIIGDTAAAIVGKHWGKKEIMGKTLEGSLSCLAGCLAVSLLVPEIGLVTGIIASVVATLVELLPLVIDDNVSIPLVSGVVLWGLL